MTAVDSPLARALAGRYAIERELGQGGMATVYLAEDLRHRRRVAVKVLRPELAAALGPERFLKEIETAAQFQHPHILPLLDSGEAGTREAGWFLYYVMPYVDGESLRARLARRGELPLHEAVKILIEICDALAYAHERGIVHRDIKPDNVLLSGRHALVTDFGVAKALSEATGRQQLTTAGVALGTPTYMAPEQATADPNIDHRADIYAVGVLGYELIAGKPPISGRSPQETLAAQVTQRPEPLAAQRPSCPAALEAVIMKCLEKRPADRWQTAEEVLAQLEPLATPSGGTTPTATRPITAAAPPSPPSAWRRWVAPAALVLTLAAALAFFLTRPAPEVKLGRRAQLTLDPGLEIDPALSPDGEFVAFVAGPLGDTRLYVRQVDGGAPVAITPEHGGFTRVPRWSPDGKRLVFLSERGLEVIPALGGAAKLLQPVLPSAWSDGTWSPDGRLIAYPNGDSVFVRDLEGGPARVLARLPEAHSCAWSPDGRWIACVSGNRQFVTNEEFGNIAASSVWVLPAAGGPPVRVTDDESLNMSPTWLPGRGGLLYVSNRDGGRDLYRVELSGAGRAGDATRLTTGLTAAEVSVSRNGRRLVYAAYTESSNVWSIPIPTSGVVSASRAEPVTRGTQVIEGFDVSPDVHWLVFDSDRGGVQQIYRMPLSGGQVEQLTTGAEPAFSPSYSPDGREIAYHAFRGGTRQVFVMPAEGGTPTQVTSGSGQYRGPQWSPDGRSLAIQKAFRTPAQEIDVVTRDSQGRWGLPRTLVKGAYLATWSPDGRSVLTLTGVFGSAGSMEIVPVGGGAVRVLASVGNPASDLSPAGLYAYTWSADGRLVYFAGHDPLDQSVGAYRVPATGGPPRLVLRFDDATHRWNRTGGLRIHGERFYFTLGDQQGDLWMTEIAGAR